MMPLGVKSSTKQFCCTNVCFSWYLSPLGKMFDFEHFSF